MPASFGFVINYVFEAPESLQELIDLLKPCEADIHVYWLTCEPAVQAGRIRARQRNELDWELQRFAELQQIQAAAAQRGFIGHRVDTTHLTLTQVAEQIWQEIFK